MKAMSDQVGLVEWEFPVVLPALASSHEICGLGAKAKLFGSEGIHQQ